MARVLVNGCFDLFHAGHLSTLKFASELSRICGGDWRIAVAMNSDKSIRAIKGPSRPIVPENERRAILMSLHVVKSVLTFDEPTCAGVIRGYKPTILVHGGDSLPPEEIEALAKIGGLFVPAPIVNGVSTTSRLEAIRAGST